LKTKGDVILQFCRLSVQPASTITRRIWPLPVHHSLYHFPLCSRIKATPEGLAHQEIPNRTSVEQSVVYKDTKTITTSKTLTFQQSLGFKMGGEVSAGLPGVASAKASFEFSGSTKSGKSYVNTSTQEISWTVPVKVPPGNKIIVDSTVKRYQAVVSFTYTVVCYSGPRENIIKEVTLLCVY